MKLIFVFFLSSVNAQLFTQWNYYPRDSCTGQPVYMSSVQSPNCLVVQQDATCASIQDPNSVYSSMKTQCSSQPLNLDGIVQLYVASYTFTQSGKCEGNPSQIEVMMADAMCHPATAKGGAVSSYFLVNCNGGKPIYKTCKDAACKDCTETQSSGNCESAGAFSSRKVECLYPAGKKGTKGGILEDDSAAKSSIFNLAESIFYCILALVLTF